MAEQLRTLFAKDPERGKRLTAKAVGLFPDYSKNRITDETLHLLIQLAEESEVRSGIEAVFHAEKINVNENKPVLHVALRAPRGASIMVDGDNVVPQVHAVLDKMSSFCNRARSGRWKCFYRQADSQRSQHQDWRLMTLAWSWPMRRWHYSTEG